MEIEKIKGFAPTGEEFVKMTLERQKEWTKLLLSITFDDVIKLRKQMEPPTLKELEDCFK